jgi:phage baseplate assembly protein W
MTDFLGRGWAFPILPDAGGRLQFVDGDGDVAQSLRLLLATATGERVMRPTFGTDAPGLVFAPGSPANLRLLETRIREAVRDFEPRVVLDSVTAVPDPEEPERVSVDVTWTVRRTNTRASTVFPFYLARPGGLP